MANIPSCDTTATKDACEGRLHGFHVDVTYYVCFERVRVTSLKMHGYKVKSCSKECAQLRCRSFHKSSNVESFRQSHIETILAMLVDKRSYSALFYEVKNPRPQGRRPSRIRDLSTRLNDWNIKLNSSPLKQSTATQGL